jgi:hypothetical protein
MVAMTAAFGWILLLDLQLYGALPDPSQLPIQLLLLGTTLLAASRWRWAPTVAALVALTVGIGSALQPITLSRLSNPETLGMQVGTVLLLLFAAATTLSGITATARTIHAARRATDNRTRPTTNAIVDSRQRATRRGDDT